MDASAIIGLVGEYDATVLAHRAIPLSLDSAASKLDIELRYEWVPTSEIDSVARIEEYDGIWCVPATPYRNMDGALLSIRWARENGVPFLGTCGGFQHAIVEYARNVLGWFDADHAESNPHATRLVIAPLACSLVETTQIVRLTPGTRLASFYTAAQITEGYRCRYGLNEDFRGALLQGPLRVCAEDDAGEIRAVELVDHPFFVASLFQPERAVLNGSVAPLVTAFVQTCAERAARSTLFQHTKRLWSRS